MNTRPLLVALLRLLVVICSRGQSGPAKAQATPQIPQWQIDAGLKVSYEYASVKPDTTEPSSWTRSNVAMGPGEYYSPTGGPFSATNFPLFAYIAFAYKLSNNQYQILRKQVPKWVLSDRFDIQASVDGNPTKDQMRLMMQTLLEDRFDLVAHREMRQLPVYALRLDKPGELGPWLQSHPDNASCSTDPRDMPAPLAALPATVVACGGIQQISATVLGRLALGARNITMEMIADSLAGGNVDRPVIDKTGLAGTFDLHIEYGQRDGEAGNETAWRRPGPPFAEALKEQLGLKLEPQTGPVEILVLDHIEQPSAN